MTQLERKPNIILLGNMQENSRITYAEFAKVEPGTSEEKFYRMVAAGEKLGIIMKYRIKIPAAAFGMHHFLATLENGTKETLEKLIDDEHTTWIASASDGTIFFNYYSKDERPRICWRSGCTVLEEENAIDLPHMNIFRVPLEKKVRNPFEEGYIIDRGYLSVLKALEENSRSPCKEGIPEFDKKTDTLFQKGAIYVFKTDLAMRKIGLENMRYSVKSGRVEDTVKYIQNQPNVVYAARTKGRYNLVFSALFGEYEADRIVALNAGLKGNGAADFNMHHLFISYKRTNIPAIVERSLK